MPAAPATVTMPSSSGVETLINVALAGSVPGVLAALGAAGLATAIGNLRAAAEAIIAAASGPAAAASGGAPTTSDVDSEGNC